MTAVGGTAETERVERLVTDLRERKLDALLVWSVVNARYLTGFTGSNALALILAGGRSGGHRFLTDFRYETQSAEQIPELFAREIVSGELLDAAVATLVAAAGAAGRLGFDDASLTVAQHTRLRELLPAGWQLIPCAGAVERMRAVKDAREIARIRAAAELADEALLRSVLQRGLVGRTEQEVAIDLELEMRRLGAEGPSFPSIVASGAHGALPHAQPRLEPIARDVLVTIDWGALHEGYCSDCTRTYATGEHVSARAREVYELVRSAQARALDAVIAGPTGRELDAVAREEIELAGHGEHFGHGLGHGVGMEIHEGPRLSRTAGDDQVRAGNVVTIEPGVYLPGECGVRIEDLVVVREDGHEALTGLPTELTFIA
ncbi:MAG TPA: Xaa-Pro peptidase family protein [Solirubrobacteraceae bacterium]|jgi:Xaa-Pro aminopeptidase|nr:Xaa-Pro peptidase family protein [Solirubrobacteraceae bacterium]